MPNTVKVNATNRQGGRGGRGWGRGGGWGGGRGGGGGGGTYIIMSMVMVIVNVVVELTLRVLPLPPLRIFLRLLPSSGVAAMVDNFLLRVALSIASAALTPMIRVSL